jgi:hypothetical protein
MARLPFRRTARNPFDRQVLGVRVRPSIAQQKDLKLTGYRRQLMSGIARKEVKAGQGSFINHWRWSGVTVTHHVTLLISAGWAVRVGKHIELTAEGQSKLDGAQ